MGYFLTKEKPVNIKWPKMPGKDIRTRLIVVGLLSMVIGYAFFLAQGGIKAWIDSWGEQGGRQVVMEGKGPILSFIGGLFFIPSVWILVMNKAAFKDPVFWPFAAIFTLCCFAATGSRYDILQALATFLMCYVLLNRNFPFI